MSTIYERSVRAALRAYKLTLSPWIGQGCRFRPTCSEYMPCLRKRRGASRVKSSVING
ncbi:MAG: membrane protein insertion efficiency factor YidD [Asticcacaulis sp.]|nr:membrane protein insertion efficiency factor YidD [Asticcacaulis sp.]